MSVVDLLLVGNLVLLAVCGARAPRRSRSRVDDVLSRAGLREPAGVEDPEGGPAEPLGNVVRFPSGDELALRRARSAHPSGRFSHPSTGLL